GSPAAGSPGERLGFAAATWLRKQPRVVLSLWSGTVIRSGWTCGAERWTCWWTRRNWSSAERIGHRRKDPAAEECSPSTRSWWARRLLVQCSTSRPLRLQLGLVERGELRTRGAGACRGCRVQHHRTWSRAVGGPVPPGVLCCGLFGWQWPVFPDFPAEVVVRGCRIPR